VRVHLYRCTRQIRQQKLDTALDEVGLAQQKLQLLRKGTEDTDELKKLGGMCAAARAIVAFKQERYSEAEANWLAAERETQGLARKDTLDLFARPSATIFEQMVRAILEKQDNTQKIFNRDLYFMLAVTYMHELSEKFIQ